MTKRTMPPGELEHQLLDRLAALDQDSAARRLGRRRSRGRRHVRLMGIIGAFALLAVGVVGVFAVHDEGFQLEGNATAADLHHGAVCVDTDGDKKTPCVQVNAGDLAGDFAGPYDWDSLFDISGTPAPGNALGTVTGPKASLPGDFTGADFQKDFKNTGTTFVTSDDTTFATGSKDTLDITPGWQCNQDNNVNSKTDIMNGFGALLENGDAQIFYFGLEKAKDNGNNNVGMWLFQDPNVGCTSSGGAVDFGGQHQVGDLLVVSAFTNGGGVSNIDVYQWNPGNGSADDPLDKIASSADCLVTSGLDSVCATVFEPSTGNTTLHMPWLTADDGTINASHPSPNFYEGGINLTAFPQFADRCFTSFLLDTRASQSPTATLFDYVLGDIDTCEPEIAITKTPDSGTYFVGQSFNWQLDVTNTGDGAASPATVTDTIPAGLTISGTPTFDVDPNTAGGTGNCSVASQLVTCTFNLAASDGNTTGAEPDAARILIPVTVNGSAIAADDPDGCAPVDNTGNASAGDSTASDTGQVTACRLTVTKTATTTYDRDFDWTIEKTVTPISVDLFDGQTQDFDYSITATKSDPIDSNFAVSGDITITNPASIAATLTSVTDSISNNGTATVSCPSSTVPAGGTLVCTYSKALPDKDSETNTASAVAYGITYTGTAAVTFGAPTNVTDDSDSVDDTINDGDFGPFTITTTHTYTKTYDCSDITYDQTGFGTKTIHNTATLVDDGDSDSADATVNCYRLDVDKTATPAFSRDFDWTIEKTVTPISVDLFDGQTQDFDYSITATKSDPTDSNYSVSGNITITNPAPMAATLTSVTDTLSIDGVASVNCGGATTVAANDSLVCTYSKDLAGNTTQTNTASAVAYGVTYTGTASVDFTGVQPSGVTDDSDSVDDTINDGDFGPFTITTTHTYTKTYDCSDITYDQTGFGTKTIHNTATLVDDGDSDSADATVNCYRLDVDKTATPAFDRDFDWTITKDVSTNEITLNANTTTTVTYTVTATKGAAQDSNYAVSGDITITNPAPMTATITSLTDELSVEGAVTVDCGGATTVPANDSLVCTYSKNLAGNGTQTNTATAVAYGVTYTGTASVDFTGVNPTNTTDDCATVDDTLQGVLGTPCVTTTYTYERTIGPYSTCGDFTVDNTATVTAEDSGATDTDSESILVHVVGCGGGCTPGFWQGGLGVTLWNTMPDPQWTSHGGAGTNPFKTTDKFNSFFLPTGNSTVDNMTMLQIVGTGGTNVWARKAARDLIAAYLNASFGSLNYPYTTTTILADWATAVAGGTAGFQAFHLKYAAANQLGCNIG